MTEQLEGKMKLIHTVLESQLKPEDKTLLTKLLMLSDGSGLCWPSVERLCRTRGMKHEKNFKGAHVYLPGLVETYRVGRKNHYRLDLKAISELPPFEVTIKHTQDPRNTPAVAERTPLPQKTNTPAVADNPPAVEGANSTKNTTENSTLNNTHTPSAVDSATAPSTKPKIFNDKKSVLDSLIRNKKQVPSNREDTRQDDPPSTEGVWVRSRSGRWLQETGELQW